MFGEVRAAHRVFITVLIAVYLVLVGFIGRRFRLTPAEMTLAGVMMLCAKYSSYQLVWISDGVHAAQGLLFALSALAILRWVDSGHGAWIAASTIAFVLNVLMREDSLAIVPVLIGAAIFYSFDRGRWTARRSGLIVYATVLSVISLAALVARKAVMTGLEPPPTTFRNVVLHPVQIVTLAGWAPLILAGAFLLIFALLLCIVVQSKPEDARIAWLWLFFALAASSAGVVESRVNLLFIPVTFYCVFAAQVLTRYASGQVRLIGAWDRPLAVAVVLLCIVVPAWQNRLQQLSMAPGSSNVVFIDCNIARGGEWAGVTSPLRRDEALRALQLLGLSAGDCSSLWDESGSLDRTRLPAGMFVPPLPSLSR